MHLPPGSRFDPLSDDWRRRRQEAGLQALLPQLPPPPPRSRPRWVPRAICFSGLGKKEGN